MKQFFEKIGDTTKTLLNSTGEGLKKYETNKQGGNSSYGSIATIISTIAATINPILGAVVGLLSVLFSGGSNKKENQQEQQREQVRDSIIGQIIPSVKSKIRGELPMIFEKQTTQLINSIGDEFEQSLQSKKEEINAAEIEREKDSQQISVKITELEKTQQQVSTAANTLLFN